MEGLRLIRKEERLPDDFWLEMIKWRVRFVNPHLEILH
jgi:hypothetical protein